MEILIPGLILVALMMYASTKIKKRAAAAFEPELIETETYSLMKPDGFLHVIDDPNHELAAYSKEYGSGDNSQIRKAVIEVDVLRNVDLGSVREAITEGSGRSEIIRESKDLLLIETHEPANESALKGFYKLVGVGNSVYRLRVAVLPEHVEEYSRKIDETLESFTVNSD